MLPRDELIKMGLRLELIEMDHIPQGVLALIEEGNKRSRPTFFDFLSPQMIHRYQTSLGQSQPFSKSFGRAGRGRGETPIDVWDLTAGAGIDAIAMALLGFRVHSFERSPVIFALLEDAFRRMKWQLENSISSNDERKINDPLSDEVLRTSIQMTESWRNRLLEASSRLSFENVDARVKLNAVLETNSASCVESRPEVIYLDPMYPDEGRSKSALPKKEMQIFKKLVGADQDAMVVFDLALKVAKRRVIVKRPNYATSISRLEPSHVFKGKTARFDMYLTPQNGSLD